MVWHDDSEQREEGCNLQKNLYRVHVMIKVQLDKVATKVILNYSSVTAHYSWLSVTRLSFGVLGRGSPTLDLRR